MGGGGLKTALNDYTASLIYGACQMGLQVSADDMSPNLIMAVADYARKAQKSSGQEEVPAMSLSELRRQKNKK